MNKFPDFLAENADAVAKKLLGCLLVRQFQDGQAVVRIVETESYDQSDPASHSFSGLTRRNKVMFDRSGRLYVYLTYGMYYCINVVTGPVGKGEAVLIRAVEPVSGREFLENNRPVSGYNSTNGPAKLCQALALDLNFNGHDLKCPPLKLLEGDLRPGETIATSPRIGISKAVDLRRRFYIKNNTYVSQFKRIKK